MRALILLLSTLLGSPSVFAFSMMNSTGIDMQSAGLMRVCQETAEKSIVQFEKEHDINQCSPVDARIVPGTTKLTGLALDKKGFVYETYVESGCASAVKFEIIVGPSKDGTRCRVLSQPIVSETN